MQAKDTEQLGTMSVGRLLAKLSVPAITAQLINMLYNMVDRMYIGHMEGTGKLALTDAQRQAADADQNNTVTAGDALLILRHATGQLADFSTKA